MGRSHQDIARILTKETGISVTEEAIQTVAVCPSIYATTIWNGGCNLHDYVKVILIQFQNDDTFKIKEVSSEEAWNGKFFGCVKFYQKGNETTCKIMSKLEVGSDGKRKKLETLSVTW